MINPSVIILKHFGDYKSLCLESVIDGSEMKTKLAYSIPLSYWNSLALFEKGGHLNIPLSLNVQSTNAKFDGILALLEIAQL